MWTMEELVDRVRTALTAEYSGAPNGRVRDLPDRRSIRWYSTIGLVDRPLGMRGRNALYGPRHLLQLVAIKRLQAAGRTLAEIQAELAGASDEKLTEVARVPAEVLATDPPPIVPADSPTRPPFWKAPLSATAPLEPAMPLEPAAPVASAPPDGAPPGPLTPAAPAPAVPAPPRLTADWSFPAPGGVGPRGRSPQAVPGGPGFGMPSGTPEVPPPPSDPPPAGWPAPATDGLLTGVPLGAGVILLVPGALHLGHTDRAELASAARPLLDLLASRGLTVRRDS